MTMTKQASKSLPLAGSRPPEQVFAVGSPDEIRDEFQRLVLGDIHGPAFGPDELITGGMLVRDRYMVGMLAPKELRVTPNVQDDSGNEDDESLGDGASNERVATIGFAPSSIGISFAVDGDARHVRVAAEWGQYLKEKSSTADLRDLAGFYISKKQAEQEELPVWRRYQREGAVEIPLINGDLEPVAPVAESPGVVVRGRARKTEKAWLVTLFLVNEQSVIEKNGDQQWLFQAKLAVSDQAGRAIFVQRRDIVDDVAEETDSELAHFDMLYRRTLEFATGVGAGVHVILEGSDPTRALQIETVNVPTYDVPRTEQPIFAEHPLLAPVVLDMKVLADIEGADLSAALMPIVRAYRAWIGVQEERVRGSQDWLAAHKDAAKTALGAASAAADRIETGISVLATDSDAAAAFRFANEAMWRQRIQQEAIRYRRKAADDGKEDMSLDAAVKEVDIPENRSWRLFQLAFFCINIPSLTAPTHVERVGDTALADLLFFPTGGGKTEAYLGLVAFTLSIRRLQGKLQSDEGPLDGSEGVAVLMRYTLRLLTSQQFQRAAALVSACESIRRERVAADPRWGTTPFRLGLWIGSATTPNSARGAVEAIESAKQRDGYTGGNANPLQLTACPWCGSLLDVGKDVQFDTKRWRTLTICSDPYGLCPFTAKRSAGEGIPVLTVDEDIYRLLPAFIIATVDKFAGLPWEGQLHLLFGRTYARCERHGFRSPDLDATRDRPEAGYHRADAGVREAKTISWPRLRPPDLIIQDELHLIAGPLGTMVGLYETAIDRLASVTIGGRHVRPKIVASTATIRRARAQTKKLFNRKLAIFPPQALDAGDTFFARDVGIQESPGRRYIGICARGQRLKGAEARLTISILAAAQKVFEKYGDQADPYMTLVGYFSSLRELAGMRRLVDDDVRRRVRAASQRGLGKRSSSIEVAELTSRVRADDIPRLLDRLEIRHRTGERSKDATWPYDVVLATNMISVGVDVQRLGLMLVVGQPKATAEYIQATSRVGRDKNRPGVVFTLYNWARPRDLSHYERFEFDHATFYRQVEPLSLTPFSQRALQRGLTPIIVSLIRHLGAGTPLQGDTNPDGAAGRVPLSSADVHRFLDAIVDRVDDVESLPAIVKDVGQRIQEILDQWSGRQDRARSNKAPLSYAAEERGKSTALLRVPTPERWDMWFAPRSLRETENTINLLLQEADSSVDKAPAYQVVEVKGNKKAPPTADDVDDADEEG